MITITKIGKNRSHFIILNKRGTILKSCSICGHHSKIPFIQKSRPIKMNCLSKMKTKCSVVALGWASTNTNSIMKTYAKRKYLPYPHRNHRAATRRSFRIKTQSEHEKLQVELHRLRSLPLREATYPIFADSTRYWVVSGSKLTSNGQLAG